MTGSPSLVKGARLKILFYIDSWVRIPPRSSTKFTKQNFIIFSKFLIQSLPLYIFNSYSYYMIKKLLLLFVVVALLSGCSQSIEEVKQDKYLGEIVSVSGTVESSIKIGSLSGYTLIDSNGDSIGVASEALPAEGDQVTAKGTLMKAPILGYYIDVEK